MVSNKLKASWEKMEVSRHETISFIKQYSIAQQRFKPNGKDWCMLDVLEHLVLTSEGIDSFFKKYPPENSIFKLGKGNIWRYPVLQLVLKSSIKTKVPIKLVAPKGKSSFEELLLRWNDLHLVFNDVLSDFPKDKYNYSVFKHPLVGPLSMKQTFGFMNTHIHHHLKQLKRIRKHPDFSK